MPTFSSGGKMRPRLSGSSPPSGQGGIAAPLVGEHVDERRERARRHAEDGAGGDHGQALAHALEVPSQHEADNDLYKHLEHLADGGGRHVLVALAVAAVGAGQADQQHGGGEGADALRGLDVVERVREFRGEEEHDERAYDTQHAEGQPRDGEGA